MCTIVPENITMLQVFGMACLVGGVISWRTGKTYYERVIQRDEEPFRFWWITVLLLFLGGIIWLALILCAKG